MKVTVFGSFAVDMVARTPHLPVAGETVKGISFRQGAGGKGFNQGIAAHRAGAQVQMITKLGRDALAQVALGVMQAEGMQTDSLLFHEQAATGTSLIFVDERTSQNEIVIVPGACATITPEDIDRVAPAIAESGYLLLQLEVNQDANERVARFAKEHGVRVIINTAPCQPVSDTFLRDAYLVTPNEVEAEALTGVRVDDLAGADRAAAILFQKGVQNVIITLGARGVYLNCGDGGEILPAYPVHAVDTTGAGDAFNGGLLAALAEGKTLSEAARFANAVAALSVQHVGATDAMPTRAQVDAFLHQRNAE